ncbi:MAG: FtsX-like permease family protein [Fluviicola sp.]
MLNKLLFRNQDKRQLVIAMIGAFLGITFLVTSIHYLIKVQEFGEGNDVLGPNTIVVQKKVTDASVFNLSKTDFSKESIDEIRNLPFVSKAQPVISRGLYFEKDDNKVPVDFGTDVFVQTVDAEFLDMDSVKWNWNEESGHVPIVLPRQFLVMLNTYAASRNIPQVSESLAKRIRFKLTLESPDRKKKESHKAYIVGFTNSVASILVPEEYMTYANEKYSPNEEQKVTQLMISSKDGQFGKMEEYMNKHGLESAESEMDLSRLKSIVGTLFLVVIGISVIAVFVAGLVLIQYMQLLITRNLYEVRTLMRIGYHPKELVMKFFKYFSIIFAIVIGIAFVTFVLLKFQLDKLFSNGGVYIDNSLSWWGFGALIFAYAFFMLSSFLTARKGIYAEY